MIKFPKAFIEKLEESDFEAILKMTYQERESYMTKEKKKWEDIRDWLESVPYSPTNWGNVFFDYITRLSKNIREARVFRGNLRYSWAGYYGLNGFKPLLKQIVTTLILKDANKKERLVEIKNRLLFLVKNNKPQSILLSDIFCLIFTTDKEKGIEKNWNINEEEKEIVKSIFLEIIDLFILIGEENKDAVRDIFHLKANTVLIKKEISRLWQQDDNTALHKMILLELSLYYPKQNCSLLCKNDIKELYEKENNLEKLLIPPPNLLLKEGQKLFESNKIAAILFLSLDYLFKGIKTGVNNIDLIKKHIQNTKNLNDIDGIASISDALMCIRLFTKEEQDISKYLAKYIVEDEQLFVLMKSISAGDIQLIEKSEKNSVIQSICKALCNLESNEPGQIDVKLMCVRWGLLNKTALSEVLMKFPKEFIENLEETDFDAILKMTYEERESCMSIEKKKWIEIRTWLTSVPYSPTGWVNVFFDYIIRLSKNIRESESQGNLNYLWNAFLGVQKVLNSTFTKLIQKDVHKKERLEEIKEKFFLLIDNHNPQSVLLKTIFDFIFQTRNSNGVNEEWNLNEEEKEVVKSFFLAVIDKLIEVGEAHKHSIRDIYTLRSFTFKIWQEINRLWEKDDFTAKHKMTLFELSFYHSQSFSSLNCKNYIKSLYQKENIQGTLVIPPPSLLLEEGKKQFETNKTETILFLTLNFLFEGVAAGLEHIEEIRKSFKSGGNLNNIRGITSISDALMCIRIFVKEEQVISQYIAKHLVEDEQLFVLMKGITAGDFQLLEKKEENKVIHAICKALYNPVSNEQGQIDVKLICVRWGLLDRTVLPEAYQIKIPKQLPNDVKGAFDFFKELQIEEVYQLEEGDEEVITFKIPEEIKEVYLRHNGSNQDEFLPIFDAIGLELDIEEWRDIHLSQIDAKETDTIVLEGLRPNEVNITKHLHNDIIPIGKRASGDICFIDPRTKSITGNAIVICYDHEQCLTGRLIANSFAEYLSREFIYKFEHVYGKDDSLRALLDTEVKILE